MLRRNWLCFCLIFVGIVLLSCEKENTLVDGKYAVLISKHDNLKYLSQKVLQIEKGGASGKSMQVHPLSDSTSKLPLTKINSNQVLIFNTVEDANNFLNKFEFYTLGYLESKNALSLREKPHFDSPEIEIVPKNIRLNIISPLLSPLDPTYFDEHKIYRYMYEVVLEPSPIRTYWVRVQYDSKDAFSRGWIILTEKTILTSDEFIPTLSKFRDTLLQANTWVTDTKTESSQNNTLMLPKSLQATYSKENQSIEALLIHAQNTELIIPSGQLWPVSTDAVLNPINNLLFEILDTHTVLISSIFDEKNVSAYMPKDISIKMDMDFQAKIYEIYSILFEGISKSNISVEWHSNLFGYLTISKKTNSTYDNKVDMEWNMPEELFKNVFGFQQVHTIVRGILELNNIDIDYKDDSVDGVLKFDLTNLPKTIFLAYKIINRHILALNFIPEDGVKIIEAQRYMLTKNPLAPTMVFTR